MCVDLSQDESTHDCRHQSRACVEAEVEVEAGGDGGGGQDVPSSRKRRSKSISWILGKRIFRRSFIGNAESRRTDLQVEGSCGKKRILKKTKKNGAMTVPVGASHSEKVTSQAYPGIDPGCSDPGGCTVCYRSLNNIYFGKLATSGNFFLINN